MPGVSKLCVAFRGFFGLLFLVSALPLWAFTLHAPQSTHEKPFKKHSKQERQGELPSLEDYALTLLEVECQSVESLKLPAPHKSYKGKDAQARCAFEQQLLRVIINDKAGDYKQLIQAYSKDNKTSEGEGAELGRFIYFAAHSPHLHLTPLMLSVIFDAKQTFELLLENPKNTQIEAIMSDEHTPLVALSHTLRPSISESSPDSEYSESTPQSPLSESTPHAKPYDSNGVSALDLSAMYGRYDFFYTLLAHGVPPILNKHPHSSGLVTFGDGTFLELILSYDEQFLESFGANRLLHLAAREGNIELLEYLILHKNVDVNALKLGESALDAALNGKNIHKKPQLEAALRLIELGAKVSEGNARRLERLKAEQNKTKSK